ncbi:MAG: DNA recombination/repair protein RecA, partial [bacterium]
VAPPFRNTEVDLIYGEGISHLGTILDYATEGNIVQKSGTWFSFDKERLGQGRDNAIRFLAEHTEIAQVIENRVRQLHGLIPPDAEKPTEEEAKAASD